MAYTKISTAFAANPVTALLGTLMIPAATVMVTPSPNWASLAGGSAGNIPNITITSSNSNGIKGMVTVFYGVTKNL